MGTVKDHAAMGQLAGKVGLVMLVGTLVLGSGCRNEEIQPAKSQSSTSGPTAGVQPQDDVPAPLAIPVDPPPAAEQPGEFAVDLGGATQFDQPPIPAANDPDPADVAPDAVEAPTDPFAESSDPFADSAFDAPNVPQAESSIQTAQDFGQTSEPTADAPAISSTYTIQSGDDYTAIADRLWNDQSKWVAIQKANPDVDPRRLKVGQVINIPSLDTDALRRDGELSSAADAASVGQTTTVKVEPGDSLSSISARVYGSEAHWKHIFQANQGTLSSPDALKVGMTLAIPPKPVRVTAPSTPQPSTPNGLYTVRPGDSLSSIAQKQLGASSKWRLIYEANIDRLDGPEDIKIGQKLKIPGSAIADEEFQTK
jgi:nucleoid-associated protein YgaU